MEHGTLHLTISRSGHAMVHARCMLATHALYLAQSPSNFNAQKTSFSNFSNKQVFHAQIHPPPPPPHHHHHHKEKTRTSLHLLWLSNKNKQTFSAAIIRAVSPFCCVLLVHAPLRISCWAVESWPHIAAHISSVVPIGSSVCSTSKPVLRPCFRVAVSPSTTALFKEAVYREIKKKKSGIPITCLKTGYIGTLWIESIMYHVHGYGWNFHLHPFPSPAPLTAHPHHMPKCRGIVPWVAWRSAQLWSWETPHCEKEQTCFHCAWWRMETCSFSVLILILQGRNDGC